jgi:hypothetical protein
MNTIQEFRCLEKVPECNIIAKMYTYSNFKIITKEEKWISRVLIT